jgi:hypothetical protein
LVSFPVFGAGQSEPTEQQRMERFREIRQQLAEAFEKDPEARVALADLDLPQEMAERLDQNGDGFITRGEAERLLERRSSQGPRDRSDFTHLNDEGFPLNVDPEVVAAEDAPLGDGDIIMGIVIAGEPRAYPVNYMNGPTNEVVNDTLGGTHIAPSW